MDRTARVLGRLGAAIVLLAFAIGCGSDSDDGGGGRGDTVAADVAAVVDAAAADVIAGEDSVADPADTSAAPADVPPQPVDVPSVQRPDYGPLPDGFYPTGAPCDPCGHATSVRGRVCAPNEQVFVNNAAIWIDAVDCDGAPVRIETRSDASGFYVLDDVPCGLQRIHIQKGSFTHHVDVDVRAGEDNDLTGSAYKLCFSSAAVRVAVITGDWDNIEELVGRLGIELDVFELYGGWEDDWSSGQAIGLLEDLDRLKQYDILMINCGGAHQEMAASSPSIDYNIREFVESGGSLYMSDYAYVYSERIWPTAINYWGNDETSSDPMVLNSADLTGIILDPFMKSYLGDPATIPVDLGLSPLVSVEGAAATTTVHVVAEIPQFNDAIQPLILSYKPTETSGHVIYTTFHNSEQHMEEMQQVLQYLMFVL